MFINRQIYDNYVFQVVKHGSLTNAAKSLRISQPALSQGLNALEKELGFKIFNRRANPITFTLEGELYYKHIQRIEVMNKKFDQELAMNRNNANDRVVIGAPAVYVNSIIIPAIKELLNQNFKISVVTASLEKLIELAEKGKIDCFISTSENLPENFHKEMIFQEEIVLCTPKNVEIHSEKDLLKQNLISLDDKMPLQKSVNAYLEDKGLSLEKSITIDQVSEAVNMVENGIGICFASKEAAEGRNIHIYPTTILGRNIYIAYDGELFKSRACEKLISTILKK